MRNFLHFRVVVGDDHAHAEIGDAE
jgi:hypothetical protein